MQQNKRSINLDVIRSVAVFCVLSVHFFLNNNFYKTPVVGERMYLMIIMRTFFMICVPLFLLLSGYLLNKKRISKNYYMGIIKILITYILASIMCILYRKYIQGIDMTFKQGCLELLNYKGAPYGWYIEMYIGLFLLIPFLNIIYNNLESKKQRKLLLITFLICTTIPTFFNTFDLLTEGWWAMPSISNRYNKVMPDFWINIYPITYYFIGCYLKEYGFKKNTLKTGVLLVISVVLFGTYNYYRSYNGNFEWGQYVSWGSFENVIMSVLVFGLLLNMNFDRYNKHIKGFITKVSELSLGIYLVSYIFDQIVYPKLNESIPVMQKRLEYYFIVVPLVFIGSLLLSYLLSLISDGIMYMGKKINTESKG